MSPEAALLVVVLLPLAGALVVAILDRWPNGRDAATVVVTLLTWGVVVFSLLPAVQSGGRPRLELFELVPGVGFTLMLEPLGMIFALVASTLWIVTSIYAFGYMRAHDEENQTRFFVCFAVAISAALGIALAGNLATLFVFYEILTFSTYPLVTHHQDAEAKRSGRVYLGVLVSTSIGLLLLAIVWTWQLAGDLDFRPGGILSDEVGPGVVTALLALYAFGIGKAALMPFHRWLPAAMVAPTPVSALLHAVAVVKAGVFSVMKIVVYTLGTERLEAATRGLLGSNFLIAVSCFTIIAASLVALRQDNLKRRLAYSTVSQLSYIVLGAALLGPAAILGGSLHIATHAVGKITLFFCAGAIYVKSHKTEISDMKGIGRQMPFTMVAFLLGSLSIIGLPPFAGVWSKWFLVAGALDANRLVVVAVLIVSSLLNIAYLLPVVVQAFFVSDGDPRGVEEAPLACTVPLCATAVGAVVLFFSPGLLYDLAAAVGS